MSLNVLDLEGAACHTGRPTCFHNAIDGDYVHILTEPCA